ncbi:MAG: HlyD family efflux transporter periplasmic adaptor subunit [Sphingomonadales bacterium]|nr:HlyD family efflux transporter periplasmic adaptor subunit [Sphingomonadales bacterium]
MIVNRMISRAAAALIVLLLAGCGSGEGTFVGYVDADFVRPAAIASGRLTTLAVHRGDAVKKGALLFALDDAKEIAARDAARAASAQAEAQLANLKLGKRPQEIALIRAQLAQAEARRDLARLTFERARTLLAQNVVSVERRDTAEAELRAAEAQVAELQAALKVAALPARDDEIKAAAAAVETAKARLAEAEWQLRERRVTAPSPASVEDTYFEPGDFVPASTPVMSLLPTDTIHVKFYVPQEIVPKLDIGRRVSIACDGCAETMAGKIAFISTQAEFTPPVIYSETTRAKLMFRIEAKPETPAALRPGLPVTVTVE